MAGRKNSLTSFLVLGVVIALFIGLLTILAKVLFIGLIIGAFLFAFYWIKNKMLGNPQQKQAQKFREDILNKFYTSQNNGYSQKTYYKSTYTSSKSDNSHQKSHKRQGRIIDVESED